NPEVGGSNPPPATKVAELPSSSTGWGFFSFTMPSPQQLRKRNAHVPGDGKQLINPERHLAANPLRHIPLGKSQNLGNVCLSQVVPRSEEHTSELQSRFDLVCRLLLEK